MGPAIGPIIGGFLGEYRGWRWVAGLLAFFSGFLTVFGFFFFPETFAPVILRKRAAELTRITGKEWKTRQDAGAPAKKAELFKKALGMPWVLLFKEPIVALMALYISVIYAILYMLFTAFPIVFQQERGWTPGIGGLAFVGIAIGVALALAYVVFIENPRYTKKLESEGGWLAPEQRLLTAMVGGVMLPAGLFIFAWTAVPAHIHWVAPIIGSIPFGCGMVLVFLGVLGYLVDSYLVFAASVLAGNTVVRSCFGVAFPLFTKRMFENLGIHWAGTLIACLGLLFAPSPLLVETSSHHLLVDLGTNISPSSLQHLLHLRTKDQTVHRFR
jgi:MFS family permease